MRLSGLLITGTDTGVGKTAIAVAAISRLRDEGVRVGAYKPAVSGAQSGPAGPIWSDIDRLSAALGNQFSADLICPQRFLAAAAPPVAARAEGREVDRELLRRGAWAWEGQAEFLIVEGAGGLLCPLTPAETVADLAQDLGFPLVIVARLGLGTINHTLLTLEVARRRGLDVAGVILNATAKETDDISIRTNPKEISRRGGVPVLAIVPWQTDVGLPRMAGFPTIDWRMLASLSASRSRD